MTVTKPEIERRYLIRMPDRKDLQSGADIRALQFEQTYLRDRENVSRRVRRIVENDALSYILTEKRPIDPITRLESETPLAEEEYRHLLLSADPDCATICKTRYVLKEGKYCYEIDVYPFSEAFAVLEIELEQATDIPPIPSSFHILADVSEDRRFSNHNLARLLHLHPNIDLFFLLFPQNP